MKTRPYDVCIIGGGPAGSTTAIQLLRYGYKVLIVECERFPRRKIGESLPPTILPILDTLGVAPLIENAGFPRPEIAIVNWLPEMTQAAPSQKGLTDPGFQADRAVFDSILLNHARECGADVWTPARMRKAVYDNHQKLWSVAVDSADGKARVSCRFIVDCAGRKGCLPGKRRRLAPPTIAFYAYWEDHSFPGCETRIDTAADKWFWAAPLSSKLVNAAVFFDPRSLYSRKKEDLTTRYRALIASSDLISPYLEQARLLSVHACSATPEISAEPIGQNFIRAGDSALTVDPLSSQGTNLALIMGVQAAVVVNTMFSRPGDSALAQRFYFNQVAHWAKQYAEISAEFYSERATVCDNEFWVTRSQSEKPVVFEARQTQRPLDPEQPIRLSPRVTVIQTGVLGKDRIKSVLAFDHPGLSRPIAFICGIPVEQILPSIRSHGTAIELANALVPTIGSTAAITATQSLWEQGILETGHI